MRIEPVPMAVGDLRFHSMTECARHFGVGIGHVTTMLDNGTLNNIGKGRNFDRKTPMWLNGVRFDSIADLARRIGQSPECLATKRRRAIRRGHDSLDVPAGRITWGQHD